MRLRAVCVTVVVTTLLLAGCSDDEPSGGGLPTGAQPPTVSVPGDDTGGAPVDAPEVTSPVQNLDKFMQSPCEMLTKSQAAELGYDANVQSEPDDSQGPRCRWRGDGGDFISITLLKRQALGIAGLYRNQQEDPEFYAYFEPVDIGGFPGVFADSYDDRQNGACGLAVGVTDQQVISLTSAVEDSNDSCAVLKPAAEAAVATMSKG